MATPSMMNRGTGDQGFLGSNGYSYRPSGSGAAPEFGTGSLANRAAQQVGRKPGDPTRIADMLRRRGNWRPAMELGVMGLQQAFQDDQGQKNFDRTKELRGLDQAFQTEQTKQQQDYQDKQGDKRYGQHLDMYGLQSADQMMRDQKHRAWQLEDQQNSSLKTPFMMQMPGGEGAIPMMMTEGGQVQALGGFYPNKPVVKPPTPEEAAKKISDSLARGMIASWDGKQWQYDYLKPQKTQDNGNETVTYDAEGNVVQKQTRRKLPAGGDAAAAGGEAGAATGAATPTKKKTSSFLESLLGG